MSTASGPWMPSLGGNGFARSVREDTVVRRRDRDKGSGLLV